MARSRERSSCQCSRVWMVRTHGSLASANVPNDNTVCGQRSDSANMGFSCQRSQHYANGCEFMYMGPAHYVNGREFMYVTHEVRFGNSAIA